MGGLFCMFQFLSMGSDKNKDVKILKAWVGGMPVCREYLEQEGVAKCSGEFFNEALIQ